MRTGYGRRMLAAAAGLMALVMVACSGNPPPASAPTSLEGKAAVEGRAIIKAAHSVADDVDAMLDEGAIPHEAGIAILRAIHKLAVTARDDVAPSLRAVDDARTAVEAAEAGQKAEAGLAALKALLTTTLARIADADTRAQIDTLVADVSVAIDRAIRIVKGGD